MRIGRVESLYRYPVKALRAESLARAVVEPGGFAGDRGRALIVRTPEHARASKTYRGKENQLLHTVSTIADAQTLALRAGLAIELDAGDEHYFDAEPVSIVFDSWLRDLEARAGRSVDALQFRPNIVAVADPGFTGPEASLIGGRLQIGDVALHVISSITRCVTISYDLATGDPDRDLQRTIVAQRDNQMGIYGRVLVPGTIEPGTPIDWVPDTPA
jgi:uncharacterized protein YcbX